MDVCVILFGFSGLIISSELLKQLEALSVMSQSKKRVTTRSNVWIWRTRFWSRLLLK